MSSRDCILLVDDDAFITEGLALTLERPGRTIVICSDVESAEICLTRYPVTHLVSDVQFSGEFGFEGLHALSRVRAIAPKCRIVLITGYATESLQRAALGLGAAAVLAKPFTMEELERALGSQAGASAENDELEPGTTIRFPNFDEIVAGGTLRAEFQPIVRPAEDGARLFGFEALARANGDWLVGGPAMLFEYAEKRSRLADLNLAMIVESVKSAAALPGKPAIFLNTDPLAFAARDLVPSLMKASAEAGVSLARIVLEITERSAFENDESAGRAFEELRAQGVRFALDDHGSAYSHLSLIERIRPSFIKVSQSFGTQFERDMTRTRIVRHVIALARDFGCETILEGIETAETAAAAAEIGADLLQGYHFGRPAPAAHWVSQSSLRVA